MGIEEKITLLVSEYNKKYSAHPLVVFDFVSLDIEDKDKLIWWTHSDNRITKKYHDFVLNFIYMGAEIPKRSLIKTEYDRGAFLYLPLGEGKLVNSRPKFNTPTKSIDPIGIDDNFLNIDSNGKELTDREVIEQYEDLFVETFNMGSTIWVSLPHTDKENRTVYSAIFALFNSKIDDKISQIETYYRFRNFIVDYLIELYKAPLAADLMVTRNKLAKLKKSHIVSLQNWINDHPEFYMGEMIQKRIEKIMPAIQSDVPILIFGETGTGKEHLAKSIHELSKRYTKEIPIEQQYFPINCSGYDERAELVDSELFGHEKGAYTGANSTRVGVLKTYSDGTVFLDEIQQMPILVQKKLKRILDGFFTKEKAATFRSVGGNKNIETKARFIFAANENIVELVHKGLFLDDFFYRINIITITIPPLRERREEILPLAEKFLNEENIAYGYQKRLSEDAKKKLQSYHFPGNIRELRSVLLRAYFLTGTTNIIRDTDLQFDKVLKYYTENSLIKPEELLDSTIFKTVSDLKETYERLQLDNSNKKITTYILVKALPSSPYGYGSSSKESAVRAFKSTWLNKSHKPDLEKIIIANRAVFPNLEYLPFINTVLSTKRKSKKG